MPTVSEQLEDLTQQRDQLRGDRDAASAAVDELRKTLQAGEQELQTLNAKTNEAETRVDATERLEAEIEPTDERLTAARQLAAAEAASTREELDAWRQQLEAELPEDTPRALSERLDEHEHATEE